MNSMANGGDNAPTIIPCPSEPTLRASNVGCVADLGAFNLTFYDNRIAAITTAGKQLTSRAWHEVAKLQLSPIAMVYLRETINEAIAIHEAINGPLPSSSEFDAKVSAAIRARVTGAAESILRPTE